ncbi:FAD-dependent oxidoreductase [soil metagenome]
MNNLRPHIAVLGGGPCGLYAARVLSSQGYKVTLIDKGERPGGLATSHRYGENWYDMGVHMLHAFDKEIFQDIKALMAHERLDVELNAKIKWAESFFRYPLQFQDMLKGIPLFKLSHQVLALLTTQFKHYLKPGQPKNAEEALIQLYGKPLYKFFFEDFTHRYWEIHPKELSATFITTKMPKLTAVDVLKKGLSKIGIKDRSKSTESALAQETLSYSRTGAEAMPRNLANACIAAGANIIQNAEVINVLTSNNQITKIIYQHKDQLQELNCDACISTIPIKNLIHAMQPNCSTDVSHAASQLRYKPLVVYGLLVKKSQCLDALYVYYRDNLFHRIGEPKNAGLIVTPSDCTVLIVEMTCEKDDAKWQGDAAIKQRLFKELTAEKICEPHEILECHISHYEHGYPVFALGFESHLETVKQHLNNFINLQTAGRQGAFTYPNMHTAMRMGKQAAENIIKSFS